jgi:hypothetical protein
MCGLHEVSKAYGLCETCDPNGYEKVGYWSYRRTGQEGAILRIEPPQWDESTGEWIGQVSFSGSGACDYGASAEAATIKSLFLLWSTLSHYNR